MSNALNSAYTYLQGLEKAALASTDPHVQAFGAAMSSAVAAFRAAVPGMAVLLVNSGIAAAAKADPFLSVLIPAEALIDPAVSGFATMFENMLIGAPAASEGAQSPQPQPE